MQCRRCYSARLIQLNKTHPQDNQVYRCQECGFIFSPPTAGQEDRPHTSADSGAASAPSR